MATLLTIWQVQRMTGLGYYEVLILWGEGRFPAPAVCEPYKPHLWRKVDVENWIDESSTWVG